MDAFRWIQNSLLPQSEEDQNDEELLEDLNTCNSLSPIQRLYAFGLTLVVGLLFMILALAVFYRPIKFALLFTFGNIMAVGSTAFLIGLGKQLGMMFDPVRVYATSIYIGSVFIALVCALWIHSKILTLIAIICEICALIWYSLSYIPFAQRMVSELFIRITDTSIS